LAPSRVLVLPAGASAAGSPLHGAVVELLAAFLDGSVRVPAMAVIQAAFENGEIASLQDMRGALDVARASGLAAQAAVDADAYIDQHVPQIKAAARSARLTSAWPHDTFTDTAIVLYKACDPQHRLNYNSLALYKVFAAAPSPNTIHLPELAGMEPSPYRVPPQAFFGPNSDPLDGMGYIAGFSFAEGHISPSGRILTVGLASGEVQPHVMLWQAIGQPGEARPQFTARIVPNGRYDRSRCIDWAIKSTFRHPVFIPALANIQGVGDHHVGFSAALASATR
jgi:hypothetical protein